MVSGTKLAWLMIVAVALGANADSEEIQNLRLEDEQAASLGESVGVGEFMADSDAVRATDRLLSRADQLLRAHNMMLEEPGGGVTDKIKEIQADIANIRNQRSALQQEAALAKKNAALSASPVDKDTHTKIHITAGAKDQDLSVAEDSKTKLLADLTTQSHNTGDGELYSTQQFDKEWQAMRGKLKDMLGELHSHVDKIKGIAQKHYDALKAHAEKLKHATEAERQKRLEAEKSTQEKVAKSSVIASKEAAAKSAEKEAKTEYRKFRDGVGERKLKANDERKQKAEALQKHQGDDERKMKALQQKLAEENGKLNDDDTLRREIERLKAAMRKHHETSERTTKAHEQETQKMKQDAEANLQKAKAKTDKEAMRADNSEKAAVGAKEVAQKALDKEKNRSDTEERKVTSDEEQLATHKSLLASAQQALSECKKKMQQLTTAYEQKLSEEKKKTSTQEDLKRDAVTKYNDGKRVVVRMKREAASLQSGLKIETAARNNAETLAKKYKQEFDVEKTLAATTKKQLEEKIKLIEHDLHAKLKSAKDSNAKLNGDLVKSKLEVASFQTQAKQCKSSLATCNVKLTKMLRGMTSVGKIADVHTSDGDNIVV